MCFRQAPVIPAALITGIRSDLPGQIAAQVTEDVFDSPTGKILLIPQGSRLIGQYDAQIPIRPIQSPAGMEPSYLAQWRSRLFWNANPVLILRAMLAFRTR